MAIYWVDPYIQANIGGIHGTTDIYSRSGTYAAPWAITDIFGSTATDDDSKIYDLSDGDEVRLKGLPMSSYLIDVGTFYNTSGWAYYRKSGETAPAGWTSARSARSFAARSWACIYNKTHTDTFSVADSDGNKPYWVFQMYDNNNNNSLSLQSSYGQTPGYILHANISPYNSSTSTTLNMQVIDWRYYIIGTQIPTGSIFFGCSRGVGVKITDGWTSETVRNGVTCLVWSQTNATSTRTFNFNETSDGSVLCDTLYDLKNTIFCFLNDTSNSYTYCSYNFYSAKGGYHNGSSYTQRFGSIGRADLNRNNTDWTRYYYYNGGGVSSSDSGAVNSFELGFGSAYYGIQFQGRLNYGGNTATARYNNLVGNAAGLNFSVISGSGDLNLTLGTCFTYQSDILRSTVSIAPNDSVTLLNNSYYASYYNFNNFASSNALSYSFPSNIYGPLNSSDIYITNTGGPYFFSTIGGSGDKLNSTRLYLTEVSLSKSNWWENIGIFHDHNNITDHRTSQSNMALAKLVCGGNDYRSTSPTFQVKSYMYLYNGTNAATSDVNLHFSTNDYDNIPVGAAFSTSYNNLYHTPMLYFNDSTKSDALCFIKPDVTGDSNFKKSIEIPCDPYTSGNTVTVTFNVETTSTFTDFVYLYVHYVDSNGVVQTSFNNFNTAITTPTNRTVTLSSVGTCDANHMLVEIRLDTNTGQGPSGNGEKFWIHDITATVT